ncbi:MAG: T9SS type A sorting domain-containing protein [Bacteroidales bacterium]|nr:T9SS type A sorting domain-containing protein [Bacteroidales bacterium]
MKKATLLLAFGIATLTGQSQTILTNQSHGFVPHELNPMKLTNYVEPGVAGKSATWDFSELETNSNFVGSIHSSAIAECNTAFPNANTVLEEFGTYFAFNASNEKLEQYGLITQTGQTQIRYTVPFVKMKYPFTYGSSFSGNFEGEYVSQGKAIGQITGSYTVSGDATGTLKLPNGKEIQGALRVKEIRATQQTINNTTVKTEDVTYRWYTQNHRFPVLVLIKSTHTAQNGTQHSSSRAAYNNNVINTLQNGNLPNEGITLSAHPNPYHAKTTITYNLQKEGVINIAVYNLSGKLVKVLASGYQTAGVKTHQFSAAEMGLPTGTYIIKLQDGSNEITRKIIELP